MLDQNALDDGIEFPFMNLKINTFFSAYDVAFIQIKCRINFRYIAYIYLYLPENVGIK